MDSTEVEASESMNVDILTNDDKQNELNDLLGVSDDEKNPGDEINDLLGNSDDEKHSDADINELLGASDDDDEEDEKVVGKKSIIKEEVATDDRSNYLDQILGRSVSATSETKTRKCGNLSIPRTFQAEEFGESFFFRTPNFIKVQPNPYDATTHDATAERKSGLTSTIVRWRNKEDSNGVAKRESNARLIKWNDGTFQLVVGDAVFDSKIVPTENCYVFEQQKSIVAADHDEFNSSQEERYREESCLECVGGIQNRVILQPTSITSDIHAKMSLKISETFKKEQKISIRDYEKITENPEKTLHNIAKREEELNRREQKARQRAEYRGVGARSFYNGGDNRRPGMNADYLNDDTQFEGENLAMLKKGFKSQQVKAERKSAEQKKQKGRRYDDEEADEDDEENDDDEMDEGSGESLGHSDDEEEEEDEDEDEANSFIDDEDEEEEDEDDDSGDDDDDDEENEGESDEEETRGKKHKAGSGSDKKDKKRDKKRDKKEKKKLDKKQRKEERKRRKREEKQKKRHRDEEDEEEEDEGDEDAVEAENQEEDEEEEVVVRKPSSSSSTSSGKAVKKEPIKSEATDHSMIIDDDEEGAAAADVQQQKKRAKHTVIDSDED